MSEKEKKRKSKRSAPGEPNLVRAPNGDLYVVTEKEITPVNEADAVKVRAILTEAGDKVTRVVKKDVPELGSHVNVSVTEIFGH